MGYLLVISRYSGAKQIRTFAWDFEAVIAKLVTSSDMTAANEMKIDATVATNTLVSRAALLATAEAIRLATEEAAEEGVRR